MANKHERVSPFPGQYDDLPLDSPDRPIQILGTSLVKVPQGSEQFLDHVVDRVRFPNGNIGWYHRLKVPHGVMMAHVDDNEKLALVKNYRHPMGRDSVELPGGGVDESEKSLEGALVPEDAKMIAELAAEQGKSVLEFLGPEQIEEVLERAAIRETSEEIGWEVQPENVQRLIPGALRGSVGHTGQTHNVFFGYDGIPAMKKHDDGEAGMLIDNRFSIDDAVSMVGHEIVDPPTVTAVNALASMYGVKPAWLPPRPPSRRRQ